MKIERLTFRIYPDDYSKDFLLADAEVWNPWLKRQPGFLNKTTRIVGNGLAELTLFWKDQHSFEKASHKVKEMEIVNKMLRDRFPGTYTLAMSSTL